MRATTFAMVAVLVTGGLVAGSTPVQAFCPENPVWDGCLPDPSGIASDAEDIVGRAVAGATAPAVFAAGTVEQCVESKTPGAYCNEDWLTGSACTDSPVACVTNRITTCFTGSTACNAQRNAWHSSTNAEAMSWDDPFQGIAADCIDGVYEHLCRFDGCALIDILDCIPDPHVPTWTIDPPGSVVGEPVSIFGDDPIAVMGDVHLYWFNGDDDVLIGVGTESPCEAWDSLSPVVTCEVEDEPTPLFEAPENPLACLKETTLRINTDGDPSDYEFNHGIVLLYTSPCAA